MVCFFPRSRYIHQYQPGSLSNPSLRRNQWLRPQTNSHPEAARQKVMEGGCTVKLLGVGPVIVNFRGLVRLLMTFSVIKESVEVAIILVEVGRFVDDGLGVGVSVKVGRGVFVRFKVVVEVFVGVGEGVAVLVGGGVSVGLKKGFRLQPETWKARIPAQMRLENTSR